MIVEKNSRKPKSPTIEKNREKFSIQPAKQVPMHPKSQHSYSATHLG
jgi:hypothetical protein